MKKTSLVQMKENQKGRVLEISSGKVLQERLMSRGIYKGREITKVSHFALRGPVALRVGRSVIALGRNMADKIIIQIE